MPAPYPTALERRLKAAYGNHKHIAIKRGIPFLFTFEQWSEWWLTDDRWSRRGRKAGQLQMGRKGNNGSYSPDNVECVTKEEKQKSQLIALSVSAFSPERRAEAAKKAGLARRGENNRRAISVVTPLGTFVTIAAAAKAHGIGQSYGGKLAKGQRHGWRYLADTPRQPAASART